MNTTTITPRKQFSRLGLGAFVILAAANVLQLILGVVLALVYPDGGRPSWLVWLLTFAPMYLVAVPLGLLVIRTAPAAPRERHSLKPGQFIVVAIISIFMMYAGNLLGQILLSLLQSAFGASSQNPVESYAMDGAVWLKVLFMVILAPIIEEFVFRKQMIDRMNRYGERLAVVTSALIFGLFHGNLSQFFYAFTLGLVFGYVYLRTGKLRYSVGLHMFINFLGSTVGPALLQHIDLDALDAVDTSDPAALSAMLSPGLLLFVVYVLCMLGLAVAGLALLCVKRRSIHFDTAEAELPKGTRFKTVYLNVGMLLLIASCLLSIVLMFFV